MIPVVLVVFAAIAVVAAQPPSYPIRFPNCQNGTMSQFPICNPILSARERAADLIGRLTVAEKINRLGHFSGGISRLELPAYSWGGEALHGLVYTYNVSLARPGQPFSNMTSFPEPIGLGATFDRDLIHDMATVISSEARAFSNAGRTGLDFW